MNNAILLQVKNLSIGFLQDDGSTVTVVDNVSFDIRAGEIFGLAGESGCGKTITALAILKLLPRPVARVLSGSITLAGTDLLALSADGIRRIRGKEVGIIFQEPALALNPLLTIRKQLYEPFEYHTVDFDRDKRVTDLLKRVGFPEPARILAAYPHELSGGMLQRIMIALAILLNPSLIIADEPTTALDVTVQAQIMELLAQMQRELHTSVLFITHNLNLIAQYADRLAVMYAGRIAEESDLDSFLSGPLHPYSRGLLAALPDLHAEKTVLRAIPGQVPQPKEYAGGCRFRERCTHAFEACASNPPAFAPSASHSVSCFLYAPETRSA